MLSSLVMGNSDVVGLLAYSLYCQCKEEWQAEFFKTFQREPDAHEMLVFELGEQTARQKVTYRFLADARLTGDYTNIRPDSARHSFIQKAYEAQATAAIRTRSVPAAGAGAPSARVVAALLLLALGIALPFTPTLQEPKSATAAVAAAHPPAPPPEAAPQRSDGWSPVYGVPINPLD
jgi:hypothetical protein